MESSRTARWGVRRERAARVPRDPNVPKRARLIDISADGYVPVEIESEGEDGDFNSPRELLQKMFESGTGDWKMISCDGQGHVFHQAVLSEQVPHFRAMFSHSDTRECVTKTIVIPSEMEILGQAAQAFLRYIYYQCTAQMDTSSGITFSLIRMGHYYNIPKLVRAAVRIVQKNVRNLDWFSGEDLWKLYREVGLWEDAHPQKFKLLDNIAAVLKRFCQDKRYEDQLLPISNGDHVLRDLILKLSREPQFVKIPAGRVLKPGAHALIRVSPQNGNNASSFDVGQRRRRYLEDVLRQVRPDSTPAQNV